MSKAPDKVWLQWIPGYPRLDIGEEVTWCEDRINDDDIGYVREDIADKRLRLLRRSKDMLEIGMPHLVELIEEIDCELAAEVGE